MRIRPIAITVVAAFALALAWPVAASAAGPTSATTTVVVADTSLRVGETSVVTITFSEAVMGFSGADLMVPNGTMTSVTSSDGGVTWTSLFTPDAGITDATNVITVVLSGVSDSLSAPGTGFAISNNFEIDTQRPTGVVVLADSALSFGETSLVTFAFSETVWGFTNADLTISNGTLTSVSTTDNQIYRATFTPQTASTDGTNVIVLDRSGVQDTAGNVGTGFSTSANYTIDTQRPTATVSVADSFLIAGETSSVTITFSEAVSGFTTADIFAPNGSLTALGSFDGGETWTVTLTPNAGVTDSTNAVSVDLTGVADAAGNVGTGSSSSANYAVATVRPAATVVVDDSALAAGETALVTITFSEAVSGFGLADLAVANGSLSNLSSLDGGVTWSSTLTPAAGITDATNIISVDLTGVANGSGNSGTGTADSNNYAIGTLRPAATVVVDDSALAAGETALVTITFTEAVTGFANNDLTIVNGILTPVASADGGVTFTATFTPTAGITNAANVITVDLTGVVNGSGNSGTGTTISNSFAVDTLIAAAVTGFLGATGVQASGALTTGLILLVLGAGALIARRRRVA